MALRTWNELRKVDDGILVTEHDNIAKQTEPSLKYYYAELTRRVSARETETMLQYTKDILNYTNQVRWMTIVVTIATLINIIIAVWPR